MEISFASTFNTLQDILNSIEVKNSTDSKISEVINTKDVVLKNSTDKSKYDYIEIDKKDGI